MSHPIRVRGLKHLEPSTIGRINKVAPYTGAWIETRMNCILSHCLKSHPIRVRGLKLLLC